MADVTRILSRIDSGDPQAAEQLLPLVYDELRKLAAARLAHEKPGQTLQATALVHEAYVRLVGRERPGTRSQEPGVRNEESEENLAPGSWSLVPGSFHSRGHFFAAAAEAMRRILVEAARRKLSQRHGGDRQRADLLDADAAILPGGDELLDLDEALAKLAAADPACAELVKLRVFAGMTVDEAALVQGVSPRTAKRNWAYARAWLGRHLAAYGPAGDK
jgi:DNA-directed RNA polymerase specialized sigma24 family protein